MSFQIIGKVFMILALRNHTAQSLNCVQCSSETTRDCGIHPGPPEVCPEDSLYCVTIRQYTPNLQDDSDANYNDQAGSRIKLEKGCEKMNRTTRCEDKMEGDRAVVECKDYCNYSGCNVGNIVTSNNVFFCIIFAILSAITNYDM